MLLIEMIEIKEYEKPLQLENIDFSITNFRLIVSCCTYIKINGKLNLLTIIFALTI